MLNEFNIIHTLKTAFPEQIGDDAAILELNADTNYIIGKDLLVENTHFRLNYQDAVTLAHKALHVNLSDIAAMGATPQFILLGLSIPRYFESKTNAFLNAFIAACKKASVVLIGGDTTHASDNLFISVTAIGTAPKVNLKYRTDAKPNDIICFAGNLGHAHIGFTALETAETGLEHYKHAFLNPNARLNEGVWLGQQASVTGMMDVSDGVYLDLKRFCKASTVAGEIHLESLNHLLSQNFKNACDTLGLDAIHTQLTGGEDYGLMFTVSPESYLNLADAFQHKFGYALTPMGYMRHGTGVQILQNNTPIDLDLNVYSHFGETNL